MGKEKKEIAPAWQFERIDYFDDRFYKVLIPAGYEIPENIFTHTEDDIQYAYLASVTTILGIINNPFLNKWRGDVGNQTADYIMRVAGDKGSSIHDCIERRTRNEIGIYITKNENISDYQTELKDKRYFFITSQDVALGLARFELVVENLQPKIISSEQTIFNINEGYAGTADQLWEFTETKIYKQGRSDVTIEPGIYLIDFKTGNAIDEKHFSQLAAYANTDNYGNLNIAGIIIVHLNANLKLGIEGVKLYLKDKEEMSEYYNHFLAAKNLFMLTNKNLEPNKFEIPKIFNKNLNSEGLLC